MSAKNVDRHYRFRSITVGFRVSPEEQEELNRAVALSGLPKQEYCYRKCMGREVVVQPNPRVHKALKTQMTAIRAELERIAAGGSVPDELQSTIDLIAVTMQGMKQKKRLPFAHLLAQMKGSPFKTLSVVYPLWTRKSITRTKILQKTLKILCGRCSE